MSTTPDRAQRLTNWWLAHRSAVAAYAQRRLDPAAADDVVAEVFLVAWRRLETAPPEVRLWLLAIARNVVLSHLRAAGRRTALAERVAAEPQNNTPDDVTAARVDLIRAWQHLDESEREVLALIAWDGLTQTQAARLLGLGRSAFSMRLARARRHLNTLADGAKDSLADPLTATISTEGARL